MPFRRTPRPNLQPSPRATRRRFRRCLPAIALGLTALALTVPLSLSASASPGGSGSGGSAGDTSSGSKADSGSAAARHLTAEAKQAGVQLGNAPMGWRERGVERTSSGQLRYGRSAARSVSPGWTPNGVLGVDVSSYQGKVKWSKWTGKDKEFAYIKATEGTTYKNPYFTNQYRGAYAAGMVRGAYHFASPSGKAGWKQARYFIRNGGGGPADGRTLPGVLDIEYNPYGKTCYGMSKKDMVFWISSFTREYRRITGKQAVIYSTTDWWKRCTGNSNAFAATNPLWIARYGTTKPGTLPSGWTSATFWQYSSNPIDQDVYPAKMKNLTKLASTKARGAKP